MHFSCSVYTHLYCNWVVAYVLTVYCNWGCSCWSSGMVKLQESWIQDAVATVPEWWSYKKVEYKKLVLVGNLVVYKKNMCTVGNFNCLLSLHELEINTRRVGSDIHLCFYTWLWSDMNKLVTKYKVMQNQIWTKMFLYTNLLL